MTTAAKTAFKTQFQYGDSATPETFTTLAEVKAIDLPDQVDPQAEVTSHDSTADEFINVGVLNNGAFTLTCNFLNDATQIAARGKISATSTTNYQLCFPNWGARTAAFTITEATEILTSATHGLTTGQPLRLTTSSALPNGLTAGTTYYVHWIDANTFTLHATNAAAVAGTGIVTVSDTGTGTQTLQIGNRLSFAGLVKSQQLTAPLKGALDTKFVVTVTGAITLT
jgi:hypothetical protein